MYPSNQSVYYPYFQAILYHNFGSIKLDFIDQSGYKLLGKIHHAYQFIQLFKLGFFVFDYIPYEVTPERDQDQNIYQSREIFSVYIERSILDQFVQKLTNCYICVHNSKKECGYYYTPCDRTLKLPIKNVDLNTIFNHMTTIKTSTEHIWNYESDIHFAEKLINDEKLFKVFCQDYVEITISNCDFVCSDLISECVNIIDNFSSANQINHEQAKLHI